MGEKFTPIEQGAITWHVNKVFDAEFKDYVGAARRTKELMIPLMRETFAANITRDGLSRLVDRFQERRRDMTATFLISANIFKRDPSPEEVEKRLTQLGLGIPSPQRKTVRARSRKPKVSKPG
jgi:hypothetical protein